MTFDYARAQQTAERLITYFGQSGTLKHDAVDYPVKFAVTDYSMREIGNGVIAAGDRRVYLEPIDFQPRANEDLLFIDGVAHKIIHPVRKLDPAGTVVYYELQVRR